MTKKRSEEGFAHSPDARQGVDAKLRRGPDGGVTVSFGDGSEDLQVSRRDFMRISGVAAATAAMTGAGCSEWRNDVEYIVPYVDRPEEIRIGMPNYYSSVCTGCAAGCGMLVTSRGGRPIKVEGNPRHPVSRGGLCARGQSHYRGLYDPDRAKNPVRIRENGQHEILSWEDLDQAAASAVKDAARGGGVGILTKTFTGSARRALVEDIAEALPSVQHYQYEAFGSDALLAASEACYGTAHIPHYDFSKADYVVSLGSDFLGTWLSPVEFTRTFSERRNPDDAMSKLVAFEGAMTLTGANADERFPVRPDDLSQIALALAHVVVTTRQTGPLASNRSVVAALAPFTPEAVAEATGLDANELTRIGQELSDNAGKSLVIAGGLASSTPGGLALETVINLLNATLGNEGTVIDRTRPSRQEAGTLADLQQLVADIDSGKIDVLIVHGANPLYNAPLTLGLREAFEKVGTVISATDRVDETAAVADYLAPSGHALESWGDSNPIHDVYSIIQPVITPLHNTRGFEESLMRWFSESLPTKFDAFLKPADPPAGNRAPDVPYDPGPWYRYMRAHWESKIFTQANTLATFDQFWDDTLRKGVFVSGENLDQPRLNIGRAVGALPKAVTSTPAGEPGDLTSKKVQLFATIPLYDGELANNGHLQELPDPITKTVWGGYAMVSPNTFTSLKLKQGQYLEVSVDNRKRKFPIIMQPGLHDDVVAVPLGYGRTKAGIVGDDVGDNAFVFTEATEDGRRVFSSVGATASTLDDGIKPAIVQGAQVIDLHRRPLFGSTTLSEYKEDASSGIHAHPPLNDLWAAHGYDTKWGMAIDMTKCTGCSACVTACQEENNIPVVGRHGVLERREMHWIRIDRYYGISHEAAKRQKSITKDPMLAREPVVALADDMANPPVYMHPMMCQHCENAPCETVCPVSATMHSEDGLNQMIYNRCVGTRYCSNNCPFKVRRYNWFSYSDNRSETVFARLYPELKEHARLNIEEPLPMAMNPEVTVRSRGVMEKCTFCVHRIRRASWQLKKEGRSRFRDGEVVTACQQACPAGAISFGDLMDENSVAAKQHAIARASTPLEDLHVKSSVAYLTHVRNAAPKHHGDDEAGH